MPGDLERIQALLTKRIGLDPETVGTSLIPRAIRLRMIDRGLAHVSDYLAELVRSEAELQALIEEVVIPESWFFRDEVPFQLFREHVRSEWLSRPARAPLRVLSIPCAGGEEPYSIVLALLEVGLIPTRYRVDAVDVSTRRLQHARAGIYSRNAFRGRDLGFQARYFRSLPHGFELDPSLRVRVNFLQASILSPTLLAGESPYDVLFCRNLLIYLDGPARAQVLVTLSRLLAPDGLLIIGHADRLNLSETEPMFAPVGDRRAFAYRRATSTASAANKQAPPPAPIAASVPPLPQRVQQPPRPSLPAPATSLATSLPMKPEPAPPGSLLDRASELANQGQHREAIGLCEQHLRQKGPAATSYFLMGMIHQAAGDRARSDECFQKAVYLDPDHDEALLALALSAERRGQHEAATTFRRRAERAALRKGVR
jgi:chemotaxis protein methyltransferase WspC